MFEIAGGIILAKVLWMLCCAAFVGICAFIAWIIEGVKDGRPRSSDSSD